MRPGERCVVAGSGTGKILGFVGGCVTNGSSGVVLGFYLALVGPHLGCAAQFWFPCCGKDVGSLGAVREGWPG